tara:strand:- start:2982 stop:4007 length:1026 start_codon:yes stop_codon:yes gene_type:complete
MRTDATESADEWNKMRDAIVSIYESNNPIAPNQVALRLEGFRPVARVDSDSGTGTVPGVGITVGRLFFIETNTITTAAGDRNKAQEVIPKLNGNDPLDSTIPPRQYLAAGDYEAWVIWRELGNTHEARVIFATENAGPGTLARDEKAQRLSTFTVAYPGGTDASGEQPGVIIKKQFVRDRLQVPIERHQFKVRKTASNKVQVDQGFVIYARGPGANLVSESVDVAQGPELTISASGSIWLYAYYNTTQHSSDTSGGTPSVTIVNYRLGAAPGSGNEPLSGVGTQFLTSAPARGADVTNRFSQGYVYYEIAKLELVAGQVFVTAQLVNGPIYINELSDSVLS